MIQQGETLEAWIAALRKNPPKARGALSKQGGGDCCLGVFCKLKKVPCDSSSAIVFYNFETLDGGTTSNSINLGKFFAKEELLIGPEGDLTSEGRRAATIWLRENQIKREPNSYLGTLASINDQADMNHAQMAELINHLATLERLHGIEMFRDPNTF